ncbi:hypothetical protein LQZ21_00710 [Treponema sp. TIM-1]|uniref:hypothetical protein n=1 Tax=Treponema sp. TIM-1 TaxID=2898417 RepID=UPI00397EB8D1
MGIASLLELKPFYEIVKTAGGPPKDTVPFIGCPRQHPSDKNRIILIYDPLGENTKLLEFKFEDVLCVEDVLSAVTEAGEGVPLVKLWIRKGAHGVILEPFEVEESIPFAGKYQDKHEGLLRSSIP